MQLLIAVSMCVTQFIGCLLTFNRLLRRKLSPPIRPCCPGFMGTIIDHRRSIIGWGRSEHGAILI